MLTERTLLATQLMLKQYLENKPLVGYDRMLASELIADLTLELEQVRKKQA